jgi:methyl-accepting chemotaxis protein
MKTGKLLGSANQSVGQTTEVTNQYTSQGEELYMTPEFKQQVQDSWARIVPIADVAGRLFYTNLFDADPSLKVLFKGDIDAQSAKLTTMITAAVSKLDALDELVPILQSLGTRHAAYGVKPEHYQIVGAALLKTLEQGLGKGFTQETKQAWTAVYGVIADVMAGGNTRRF